MSNNNGTTRVLIAARSRELRDYLRRVFVDNGRYEVVGSAVDGQEAVQLSVLLKPDVALIQNDLPIYNGLDTSEMISLAMPEVKNILLVDDKPDHEIFRKAMKSGVKECLSPPFEPKVMLEAIDSLAGIGKIRNTDAYNTATDPTRIPKLIVVTGGKGGIGKTTITTSVAASLARTNPDKVVIFDLYTQFGDVATMLDLSPTRTLSDMLAISDEIDIDLLESYMLTHAGTGVRVLSTAVTPQQIDAVGVEHAEAVIHALKRNYTYIVVDLPPILYATTLFVLANCYHLLMVTNMFDMPTLKNAREMLDTISGTYLTEDKISIIANRVSKFDRLPLQDVEAILGRKVTIQVPNDRRLVVAVNQGVPFMRAFSKSPMVKAIDVIANKIINNGTV